MCACTSTYMFVLGRCVCFCICGPSFVFGRMYLYLQLMYFSVCNYLCSLCISVWVACVFAEQKKMWSRLLLPTFATLWLSLAHSGDVWITIDLKFRLYSSCSALSAAAAQTHCLPVCIDKHPIGCVAPFLPPKDHFKIRGVWGLKCTLDLALRLSRLHCLFLVCVFVFVLKVQSRCTFFHVCLVLF